MSNLKGKSMSELIHMHNELANKLGGPNVTEFKNLAAARAAVETLEKKMTNPETATPEATAPEAGVTAHTAAVKVAGDQKYNSTGKRGPNQGVGAFAKGLITEGKTNAEVLAAVKEKFPEAKTTTSCIAYYRTALKKGPNGKAAPSPEELRAKAQALLDQAAAAEAAKAEAAKAEAAKAEAAKAEAPAEAPAA